MGRYAAVVCISALTACIETRSVTCSDGSVCPPASVCASVVNATGVESTVCVRPAQLTACDGLAESEPCELPEAVAGGACHSGVCLPIACANAFVDPGEVCDDGNVSNADECSFDCRSTLACRNSYLDEVRGEDCDDGNAVGHDGCASTCQFEQAKWSVLEDARPAPRSFAAMAYDPRRHSAVLFGGIASIVGGMAPFDDLLEWDGKRWTRAPADTTAPANRYAHTMVYDAAREQLVLFSGTSNQGDTWVRSNGTWTQLTPPTSPPTRDYAGMAYDSARKLVVLFGGYSVTTQGALGDTWVWNGTTWTEVTVTGPAARMGVAMAYDPRRNVTVLFGGGDSAFENDVWEFDGVSWTERTPASGVAPSPRAFARMAYDPISGEILLTGGNDGTVPSARDAFTWNGTRWLARDPLPVTDSDETFNAHSMATDPLRGRVVVLETKYGRLYEWDGASWSAPPGGARDGEELTPRAGAAVALDLRRNQLVLFGGEVGTVHNDETWLSNGDHWRRVMTATQPSPRWGAAIAYDEVRDEVILYGGCPSIGDTWIWRGRDETWTRISATSPPGQRCGASLVFDAKRGHAVLLGGLDGTGVVAGASTWIWDGTAWSLASTATLPPARAMAASAYDRVNERVLLFGGRGNAVADLADMWSWDGATWSEITAVLPPPRIQAGMAWDPARRRIVLAAGYSQEAVYTFSDAYDWDGSQWTPITSDFSPRRNVAMATAPDGAGVIAVGGNAAPDNTVAPLSETLRLRYDGDVGYEACRGDDTDGDGYAGCADPDCAWICTPLCSPLTSCVAGGPSCGDQTCSELESCSICPGDCGECPTACGDFACNGTETLASCPGDCTP